MNRPKNNKSIFAERYMQILLALIPVIGGLLAAYWQFVYKPAHADELTDYLGRVVDASNRHVISGAKVSVESRGLPQIYYSDSEGVFYAKLGSSSQTVRIRVDAEGYEPFDRNASISRTGIEEIRLTPIPKPVMVTPPTSPTPNPKPSQGPIALANNVVLTKIEGDGQDMPTGGWKNFTAKALDRGRPVVGAKVAWQTPDCGLDVYVRETNKDGLTSATNMCNSLSAGTHAQTATLVQKDIAAGFSRLDRVVPIGKPILFTFHQQ